MSNGKKPPEDFSETIMRPGWVNPGGKPTSAAGIPQGHEGTQAGRVSQQASAPGPILREPRKSAASGSDNFALDFDLLRGSVQGLGPLLPFLLFAFRLRGIPVVIDPEALRARTELALKRALEELPKLGWDPRYTELARYFVCCAIDEAAQSAPWGKPWAARPLTSSMSQNAIGGEKFFSQIDVILRQPQIFDVRMFEVAYGCLLTGFRGQFALQAGGEQQLVAYREALEGAIREKEPHAGQLLFQLAIPADRPPRVKSSGLSLWIPAAAGAALLAFAFVGFRWGLQASALPVVDRLNELAATQVTLPAPPVAPPRPTVDPSTLDRIRAIARRTGWGIAEDSGLIVIAVSGGQSFPSGSATLDSPALGALRELGVEYKALGATLLIRGHSDAQPIRSFQFQNNVDLSRARAASVAAAIEPALGRSSPVEGVGEQMPLCQERTPQCFGQNRRVDVIARYEGVVDAN
jgi:type VI secretion system protein ImpK